VKLGGVLDYTFELLRTIHTGIVAEAEWYNFRIATLSLHCQRLKGILPRPLWPSELRHIPNGLQKAMLKVLANIFRRQRDNR